MKDVLFHATVISDIIDYSEFMDTDFGMKDVLFRATVISDIIDY